MDAKQQNDMLSLIARNLAGNTDSDENAKLNEWFGRSESNRKYFEQIINIWDASEKKIDPEQINTSEALKQVINRISEDSQRQTFWHYWQKAAAVIIILLAVGSLFWIYINSQKVPLLNEPVYNEVYAMFGTRSSIILGDGTVVWLNAGSSLKYPDKFTQKERQVYLKGEAYFEVKSDVSRPFIVKTSNLLIKATGTKFNVLNYDSNPVSEVALFSGNVSVNKVDGRKDSQLISELKPNQYLIYNKQTGIKTVTNEDVYKYFAWKDGKLIFRNDPLSEVVKKIGMIFNVDIELQDTTLQNYRYRATFQEESFEEILRLLKLSSPIDYIELRRYPLPDGSFPKKKVVIFSSIQKIHN